MKHYTHLTARELRAQAHRYNIQAARQVADGIVPTWDRPADHLEEVLDELTDRVGAEAVEMFRDKLADEHAHVVATAEARNAETVNA